jgi:hypothetical protein
MAAILPFLAMIWQPSCFSQSKTGQIGPVLKWLRQNGQTIRKLTFLSSFQMAEIKWQLFCLV